MLFQIEERNDEDQPGSMDRISERGKKRVVSKDITKNVGQGF